MQLDSHRVDATLESSTVETLITLCPAADYDRLIKGPCKRFGIVLKPYSNKKSISSSSIITVFNMDNGDLGRIGELVREITAVDESSPTGYDSLPDNAQRGARQKHYGFSPNYSLERLPASMGGQVCPRLVGGAVPPETKEVFRLMTELGDEMFNHHESRSLRGSSPAELYGNRQAQRPICEQDTPPLADRSPYNFSYAGAGESTQGSRRHKQ